ncbi:hypothetical protein ACVWW6_006036 [Bradyrhizobium sp. USDA 3311]
MRARVRELMQQGDGEFAKWYPVHTLWQTLADNFYPMRGDFTRERWMSEEFASYLMTGRPALAHRDLSNSLAALLRQKDSQWFVARTRSDEVNNDSDARRWLDRASGIQYRVMYAQQANFVRSMKEADQDYSAFGQAVLEIRPNGRYDGLSYATHHLKNCVWFENSEHHIDGLHRKWRPQARQLKQKFPKTIAPKVDKLCTDDPFRELNCRHIVLPWDEYDYRDPGGRGVRAPFVSIHIDIENETILEETPLRVFSYVVPQWARVSNSPIAYSPAAVLGLPDARMLQDITLTILEAGQKVVDPPMIGVGEAINGDTNLQAGGVTWTDADYDERTGEVLRPITLNPEGLKFGAEREEVITQMIDQAFYLNQIRMPTVTKEMTADETERVYQEFIRQAVPLLEPIETDYSGKVCDVTFQTLMDMKAFGPLEEIPKILSNHDIKFDFDSPLQAAKDKLKVGNFQQSIKIVVEAMQVKPDVVDNFDFDKGTRDAVMAQAGAEWIVPEKVRDQTRADRAKHQAIQQGAQTVAAAGDAAQRVAGAVKSAGDAAQAIQQAGIGQ